MSYWLRATILGRGLLLFWVQPSMAGFSGKTNSPCKPCFIWPIWEWRYGGGSNGKGKAVSNIKA